MSDGLPEYTLGIEEEYLLVDAQSGALVDVPDALMRDCVRALGDKVSPEFLACQIEVGTGVCADISEARADLGHLRRTIADCAAQYGMAPLAVSCHPFADWHSRKHTEKQRYNDLARDLAGVVRRMLISGTHVHVGLPDDDLRIDIMRQMTYFLPHLLALSTSSPFWGGQDTGLNSYRLTIFDNLPRTGLPPDFVSHAEYRRSVDMIINAGLIEDTTKIWWDIRPSARFPTLEARICDVMPVMEHALTIAALVQSITRMLVELRRRNQRWRIYDRFLIAENRWRAQRYGPREGLLDIGKGAVVPMGQLVTELIELLEADAMVLGCLNELRGAQDILAQGTSADRQRATYADAREAGADHDEGLREVVRALMVEFRSGL
ncbi:carboxylate-amine ligase [Roseinatronobacter thiooxidans]|uniref:Putative glutamate--cysteine ligase 2 n=1 Tax=Roseinatronobacter thiooxidans TaxID=121821 RepID=A0A2W7QFX4_9RHOB|nr:carboxylate-amine ligase [Roseinatronobacter thiooxidans]PZX47438.1 carboxylate-amine ligase [Roseinatronobacter thiooxidans]